MPKSNTQCALVIGASGGVGRALADLLAKHAFSLLLVGRREKPLNVLAEKLAERSSDAGAYRAVPLDITDPDAGELLVQEIHGFCEKVDALIFAAGKLEVGRMDAAPGDHLDAQLATNATAVYRITKAVLPYMKQGSGDVIICNSSILRFPREGLVAYGMSQAALWAFAEGLRREANPNGTRVLSVFLGRTATERMEKLYALESRKYSPEDLLQPEDVAATIVHALTLPRTAEITELHIRPTKNWAASR
jgi:NADP-dependent 3-hydroxy acid dehydrogenase YdfG